MPSLLHEGLVNLFRNRPALAPELLRDALHASLPSFDSIRVTDADLTEVLPTERRADLVMLLEEEVPRGAVVLEVQLSADPEKAWSWPMYVANLRARLRCGVALLVVTTDDAVAQWAARRIEMGHPDFALTPMVVGPRSVPRILDEAQAALEPELAVLSALAHADGPDAPEIASAAIAAAVRLDDDRAGLYVDLVLAHIGEAARASLEELMASKNYEYQSDFAKRYFGQGRAEGQAEGLAEGRAEGLAQGRAEGLAEALLRVLAARGLDVSRDTRERIVSCKDVPLLDAWLTRAATAETVAEVLGEG